MIEWLISETGWYNSRITVWHQNWMIRDLSPFLSLILSVDLSPFLSLILSASPPHSPLPLSLSLSLSLSLNLPLSLPLCPILSLSLSICACVRACARVCVSADAHTYEFLTLYPYPSWHVIDVSSTAHELARSLFLSLSLSLSLSLTHTHTYTRAYLRARTHTFWQSVSRLVCLHLYAQTQTELQPNTKINGNNKKSRAFVNLCEHASKGHPGPPVAFIRG